MTGLGVIDFGRFFSIAMGLSENPSFAPAKSPVPTFAPAFKPLAFAVRQVRSPRFLRCTTYLYDTNRVLSELISLHLPLPRVCILRFSKKQLYHASMEEWA